MNEKENKSNIMVGMLDALCETGTEGIIWCLYHGDFLSSQWEYKYSMKIDIGDYLKVLSPDYKSVVWEGVVEYDRTIWDKPSGHSDTLSHEEWAAFFMTKKLAILYKNENKHTKKDAEG